MFFFLKKSEKSAQGFTLAELLIALAILGVIATFTIPKILIAQQNAQRQSVLKEDLATMAALINKAIQDGVNDSTDLQLYVRANLNYLKRCGSNPSTEGCWDPTVSSNADGYLLPNGSSIQGFNQLMYTGPYETIAIDANGPALPNVEGQDQIYLVICIRGTCNTIGGTGPKIQGSIGPDQGMPVSVSFYEQIFAN